MGAITHERCLGMKTLDQGMNGKDFQQFLEEEIVPQLWSGAVLVMDNLPAHMRSGIL